MHIIIPSQEFEKDNLVGTEHYVKLWHLILNMYGLKVHKVFFSGKDFHPSTFSISRIFRTEYNTTLVCFLISFPSFK